MMNSAAIAAACCLLQLSSASLANPISGSSANELLQAAREQLGFMTGVRR
jgi:hypothetical protein